MNKFVKLTQTDTFEVKYHITNGRVFYDTSNWNELKKITSDDIEALEVIESLLGRKSRELTAFIDNAEFTVMSDLEKANELNNDKTLSNAVKRKQKADELLSMDESYQMAKNDLEALTMEISRISRTVRALTRAFIAEYSNFSSKV
jgi:hypothetical protein